MNPIRSAIAEMLEQSDDTSIQRRIQALKEGIEAELLGDGEPCSDASQAIVSSLVGDFKRGQAASTLIPGTVQQPQEVQDFFSLFGPAIRLTAIPTKVTSSRLFSQRYLLSSLLMRVGYATNAPTEE